MKTKELKAVKKVLNLVNKCNMCSSPATQTRYTPKIKSHYHTEFVCDKHSNMFCYGLKKYKIQDIKEYWDTHYNSEWPPKKYELQDLPEGKSIRLLISLDQKFWDKKINWVEYNYSNEEINIEDEHLKILGYKDENLC
jgi:hypothetical protein